MRELSSGLFFRMQYSCIHFLINNIIIQDYPSTTNLSEVQLNSRLFYYVYITIFPSYIPSGK